MELRFKGGCIFIFLKEIKLNCLFFLNCRIFTLYSKSLPLDLACRVWDVFCRDGEEFLFRTGLGILRLYEDILQQMDFIHIAQFLTKLPEDITSEKLFSCIAAIQMQNSNKKWAQVSFLGAVCVYIYLKTDVLAHEYMGHFS